MLVVADVMTTRLVTLAPSDSLKTAKEIMRKEDIRHLLVVSSQGIFVGLLSQRDILKAAISHFADVQNNIRDELDAGIPVSEIMETEVLSIPPTLPLKQAGELLLAHKFGCLPVLERGKLCGILAESDFVKLCLVFLEQVPGDAKEKSPV